MQGVCITKLDIIAFLDLSFFSRTQFTKTERERGKKFDTQQLWIMDLILEDTLQQTLCWKFCENRELI